MALRKTRLFTARKGQFYLLTAIIFVIALFGIAESGSSFASKLGQKNTLKEEYELEAKNVINNAIYEGLNTSVEVDIFSQNFLNFQSRKKIELGILLMLKEGDSIFISNHLGKDIIVNGASLNNSISIYIPTANLTIEYEDLSYNYSFEDYPVEFKSFMVEKK